MKKWMALVLVFSLMFTGRLFAKEKVTKEKNLVAYWSFDETEGSLAKDYSGKENNAKSFGATRVSGISGNAFFLKGTGCLVCRGGLEKNFIFLGDYSLEVWVKHESGSDQGYVSKWTGTGDGSAWWLGFAEGVVQFGDYYERGQSRIKGPDIADNEWHYVVGVREGTSIYLYIDGEKIREGRTPAQVAGDNPGLVYIGCVKDPSTWPFKGIIDEVRVYSRALSEEEIKKRYDLIKSGKKQVTLEPVPNEDMEAPLVFSVSPKAIHSIYDKKEPIQFSVFITGDRPAAKKEEKKVLFLLTDEKDNVIGKAEQMAALETGERNKEVSASFSAREPGDYNLEVKIGEEIKMKKNIVVRDIDAISKENIKIREERRKNGPVYRGIISAYGWLNYKQGGSVDVDATIDRLKNLGVNCYAYLIASHSQAELAALPEFCSKAAQEGLEVWVFIAPPTEAPINAGKDIKEIKYPPFDMDYLKWAEAIAKISAEHPNLTLWMIDDYDYNLNFFTVDYTREIYETVKKINPKLLFGVCVYYASIKNFVDRGYLPYFDAVVWGYQDNFTAYPDCGISAKSLPLEIKDYYNICTNKILIPCIYFTAHSSWPQDRPTRAYLEETIKISYEQTGMVWVYTTPHPGHWKHAVVKNYIDSIKLEKWTGK